MAFELSSQQDALVEEKETPIISPPNEHPTLRKCHFLKPILPSTKNIIDYPHNSPSTLSLSAATLGILSQKVKFNCWRCVPKKWVMWVEKLKALFETKWKQAGIYEAIMASTYEIPSNRYLVFKIVEKWSPVTNSFFFPSGEATITLEDVTVLAGYSAVGESLLSKTHGNEFQEIEDHLVKVRSEIIRSKARKACTRSWLNFWLENEGSYEHEAFLSMWLSRFVFPADSLDIINKSLFPIAIRLARGTRIALAPAVLASLYRDLRLLKYRMMEYSNIDFRDIDGVNVGQLNLRAPVQLVQVWVWERFSVLRPDARPTTDDKPRLARWHKLKILRMDDDDDDTGLRRDGTFLWRPYGSSCCELYKEKEHLIVVNEKMGSNLDLLSYARIISVSELLGFDCIEQYLPHRVARQFGFDQDIPDQVPRRNSRRDIAWIDYMKPISGLKLYIPSSSYNPGVTPRYLNWWKEFMQDSKRIQPKEIGSSDRYPKDGGNLKRTTPKGWEDVLRVKKEMNEAEVPPGFAPKKNVIVVEDSSDDDEDQMPIGRMFALGSKSSKSEASSSGDNVIPLGLNGNLFQDFDMGSGLKQIVKEGNQSNVGSPVRCDDAFAHEILTVSSSSNGDEDGTPLGLNHPSTRSLENAFQDYSGTRSGRQRMVDGGIGTNVGCPPLSKDVTVIISEKKTERSSYYRDPVSGMDIRARIARLERLLESVHQREEN